MNVSGFNSNVSDPRHLASSASAGADSNATSPRRASSSMTSKPTLWRVPLNFAPGFPSPAMSFIRLRARPSARQAPRLQLPTATALLLLLLFLFRRRCRSSRCRLRAFLFLLALLDDLGLRRRGDRSRRRIGRRRGLFGLRHDDVHEHHVGIADGLPL